MDEGRWRLARLSGLALALLLVPASLGPGTGCSGGGTRPGAPRAGLDAGPDADLGDGGAARPDGGSPQDGALGPGDAAPDVDLAGPAELGPGDGGDPDVGGDPVDAGLRCRPAGPAGTERADGYPLDGWRWAKQGLVFPAEAPGAASGDGDLAPTLLVRGEELWLIFQRKRGTESTLWLSRASFDGAFSPPTELVDLSRQQLAGYPALASAPDGAARLALLSGSLELAASTEGQTWTPLARQALGAAGAGHFDALSLLYPSLRHDPSGGWLLWYTGYDGRDYAIGLARSADGLAWQRAGEAPGLVAGPSDSYDNRAVAQPCVHPAGDPATAGWWMWYGGYDTSRTDPGPWRVALARSADGQAWERLGVSLPLGERGADAYSTRDPAVVPLADGWRMVYVGLGTDLRYRLLGAVSDVCPP